MEMKGHPRVSPTPSQVARIDDHLHRINARLYERRDLLQLRLRSPWIFFCDTYRTSFWVSSPSYPRGLQQKIPAYWSIASRPIYTDWDLMLA
jgi:hypothetical protein